MTQLAPTVKSYAEIKATKKMRWWYEHLADFMIAHPRALQNDIAAHFGKSPGTISTIINSDAFQAYLRARRAKYADALDSSVRTKMLDVADKGFDLILDRFDKKRDSIPLDMLVRTTEMALKAAQPTSPSTVVNVGPQQSTVAVAVSLEDLQAAQQALRNAQSQPYRDAVVEGEFTEAPSTDLEDLA